MIFKVVIPEAPQYDYEVGKNGVKSIDECVIQTGSSADGHSSSKLIYRVTLENDCFVELSADMRGIVLYKIDL